MHEIVLDNVGTIDELKQILHQMYPRITALNYSIAVNKIIVNNNQALNDTDEIALLPPFSGG